MGLNFKATIFAGLALMTTGKSFALDEKYFTVVSKEVHEIASCEDAELDVASYYKGANESLLNGNGNPDPIERAGKVISIAKDLVALGEDVYKLVVKGKPTISTKYAPISVVPKENGEAVDIMSTEHWKTPVKRPFEITYKNVYGIKVVKFRYSVIFAYGGSYNGKGAYLTAVQIVPESVSALYGYDFSATMKLGGIQNNGSRENPVAGATLLMEHTVSTIIKSHSQVDTVFVGGNGEFQSY